MKFLINIRGCNGSGKSTIPLSMMDDPDLEPLLLAARQELGCGEDEIRERFLDFVIAVFNI